eukprot:Awhi_evm1s13518
MDRDKIVTLMELLQENSHYDSFERESPEKFKFDTICIDLKDEEEYLNSKGLKNKKREKVNWAAEKSNQTQKSGKKDHCIKCLKDNHIIDNCK